jgi:metal-dependent HD superfamily phosphatase/phosphodiesterase
VEKIRGSPLLERAYTLVSGDPEIRELLRMSNVMAVERLLYNDHGPIHAAIVAGSALEIFDLIYESGVLPSTLTENTLEDPDEARLVVLLGAYLHDIGNSVHRENHELIGAMLADRILERLLPEMLPDWSYSKRVRLKSEVLHVIYATAPGVKALTVEAGVVKVADATDMAEGRARIPYLKGKLDMHSLSALSIKRVEIERGSLRPVRIKVFMTSYAGFFQIERVLLPKVETTPIREHVEVAPFIIKPDGSEEPLPPIHP